MNGCKQFAHALWILSATSLLYGPLYAADTGSLAPPTNLRILSKGNVDCVHEVWSNLEVCGWPGPSNTGYPAGMKLNLTFQPNDYHRQCHH